MSDYETMMTDAGKAVAKWLRISGRAPQSLRPKDGKPDSERSPLLSLQAIFKSHSRYLDILTVKDFNRRPYVIDSNKVDKTVEALIYAEEFECAALLIKDNDRVKELILKIKEMMDLKQKVKGLLKELCIAVVRKKYQKTVDTSL